MEASGKKKCLNFTCVQKRKTWKKSIYRLWTLLHCLYTLRLHFVSHQDHLGTVKTYPLMAIYLGTEHSTLNYGHTRLKAPHPVRSAKSSSWWQSQYYGGGPHGNTLCCNFCIFFSTKSAQVPSSSPHSHLVEMKLVQLRLGMSIVLSKHRLWHMFYNTGTRSLSSNTMWTLTYPE